MAGDIFFKERAIISLANANGASLTNGTGAAATTADLSVISAGNAAEDMEAMFELTCQWATITSIIGGVSIADLFLVPKLDGANLADVDTTSGASRMPAGSYVDTFICAKAPTAATNMRFVTGIAKLFPALYTAYLLNRSGQTISANWTLKVVTARGQYT